MTGKTGGNCILGKFAHLDLQKKQLPYLWHLPGKQEKACAVVSCPATSDVGTRLELAGGVVAQGRVSDEGRGRGKAYERYVWWRQG